MKYQSFSSPLAPAWCKATSRLLPPGVHLVLQGLIQTNCATNNVVSQIIYHLIALQSHNLLTQGEICAENDNDNATYDHQCDDITSEDFESCHQEFDFLIIKLQTQG